MGHLKECESSNRIAAGQNKSRSACRPAGRADRSASSANVMDGASAPKTTFAEDFMLEHSNSSLFIAMMGSVGRQGAAAREPQKSTQHFGFPS